MDLLRSLPIGLYLEQPITWLHSLDSRVKFFWLMAFLLSPVLASSYWRLVLVILLILITWSAKIPKRVWRQQMGWWLTVATLVAALTAITPDGLPATHHPTRPLQAAIPALPDPTSSAQPGFWTLFERSLPNTTNVSNAPLLNVPEATSYRYILWRFGRFKVTRHSLDIGVRVGTLIFTLIYGTNLYLLTTSPEEITAGMEDLLYPLHRFKWPITEITLTLTLALRFIPLVMEEGQNLVRSVWTRAINWKKLGLRGGAKVWLQIIERFMLNLLLRAEQIAGAIQVRGFTSPNQHQVQWHDLRLGYLDGLAIVALLLFCGIRLVWGNL